MIERGFHLSADSRVAEIILLISSWRRLQFLSRHTWILLPYETFFSNLQIQRVKPFERNLMKNMQFLDTWILHEIFFSICIFKEWNPFEIFMEKMQFLGTWIIFMRFSHLEWNRAWKSHEWVMRFLNTWMNSSWDFYPSANSRSPANIDQKDSSALKHILLSLPSLIILTCFWV